MHLTGPWIQNDRREMVAPLADAQPLTVPFGVVEFIPDSVACRYERTDAAPWRLTRITAEGGRLLKTGKPSSAARHQGEWTRTTGHGSWSPAPPAWLLVFADQWAELFNDPNAWRG